MKNKYLLNIYNVLNPISSKEEKNLEKWLKKQRKFDLVRTSRNFQRECQICLNIFKKTT